MSAVGKVATALASVSNEVTVAAAQFNVDFTLMKVEAPPEYQRLGTALSGQRRDQAENGQAHTTACKLGALFEHIMLYTPRLFAVYSQRASEIAESVSQTAIGSHIGPFASHVGPDGTSI
jgi:hypothetical protein